MKLLCFLAVTSLISVSHAIEKKDLKPKGTLIPTACGINQLEYEKSWEPIEVCLYRVQGSNDIEVLSTRKPEGISYHRWEVIKNSNELENFEDWKARPVVVEKERFHLIYKGESKDVSQPRDVRYYPETLKLISPDLYFYVSLQPVYSTF